MMHKGALHEKLRIQKVVVTGNTITNDDMFMYHLDRLGSCESVAEISEATASLSSYLRHFSTVKGASITLMGEDGGRHGDAVGCTMLVRLTETRSPKGSIGVTSSQLDGVKPALAMDISYANAAGRGEEVSANVQINSSLDPEGSLRFTKPYFDRGILSHSISASLFANKNDLGALSAFHERQIGAEIESHNFYKNHSFALSHTLRTLTASKDDAPLSVRLDCGHSAKNAVRHTFCFGQVDDNLEPRKGYKVRVVTELAGLGGDIGMVKQHCTGQVHVPLPGTLTFHGVLRGNIALPIPIGGLKAPLVCDRIHMGGMASIRGFEERGASRRDNGYAVGEYNSVEGSLAVSTGLPKPFADILRLHTFLDWGVQLDGRKGVGEVLRATTGAGLVLCALGGIRLEVNL
eukprot:CAMPEP_0119125694 /NCGR_PEP_ID=MMETSP1310-20130426/4885_1 /TAXON_ID=464262 /ORGANISM="Genus nov. species nov., Strain RCC2339" /LENGTH=404 /DNA_ID=CAMNT_0007115789 /DNA_START=173 /DNA_END=1384 /DNA_ORIENTATION=-